MSKANKYTMVRLPVALWELIQAYGLEIDRSGAWVVEDWLSKSAKEVGIQVPVKFGGAKK